MPSTVGQIFASAGLEREGYVRWGERIPEQRSGVYIVALSPDADRLRSLAVAPLSAASITELLAVRPELTLDGKRPRERELAERLASFWLPDETVVYIGLAGTSLRSRVRAYYKTPLGARRPHAGGWFLKTLANVGDLSVHYARAGDPGAAEGQMLGRFCSGVSKTTLAALRDRAHPFPFANLEWPRGVRKAHGIKGARGDSGSANSES